MRTHTIWNLTRSIILLPILSFHITFISCKRKTTNNHVTLINNHLQQKKTFANIAKIIKPSISERNLSDSISFLIMPIQVSCPACRKKVIESIAEKIHRLDERRIVVLSASGGIRTIESYFMEYGLSLPKTNNRLVLDTAALARQYSLYEDKPTFYYSHNGRVYKKVSSIPHTIRKDLKHFFE